MRRSEGFCKLGVASVRKKPLALHFLFQYPQGLFDIVVAYFDAQFIS